MFSRPVAAGVLSVFRVVILFRIVFWLYEALLLQRRLGFDFKPNQFDVLLIAIDLSLLAILFWLERDTQRTTRWLPWLLLLSALPQFFQTYLVLDSFELTLAAERAALGPLPLSADLILWQVLIAWQYNFRTVLLAELFAFSFDWVLLDQFAHRWTTAYSLTLEELVFRTCVALIVGYIITQLAQRVRRQAEAQQIANTKLANYAATVENLTIANERNRLARELHDTLSHSLSALSVQLEASHALLDEDPQTSRELLAQAKGTAKSGMAASRRALDNLRARPLEQFGLLGALERLARNSAETNQLNLTLTLPPTLSQPLSPLVEQALYRITQEALENIARHAEAEQIRLTLHLLPNGVRLSIHDDGIGFDPDGETSRWGIQGMRERALMLGGALQIDTSPESGTTISVEVIDDKTPNL
ncbi:MAG: sensor histidine kinase [Candidatus Promineifilaceae bacterium]